jgi:hypothetical protein
MTEGAYSFVYDVIGLVHGAYWLVYDVNGLVHWLSRESALMNLSLCADACDGKDPNSIAIHKAILFLFFIFLLLNKMEIYYILYIYFTLFD